MVLTWRSLRQTPPGLERPACGPGSGSLGILINQKPRLDDGSEGVTEGRVKQRCAPESIALVEWERSVVDSDVIIVETSSERCGTHAPSTDDKPL